MKKLLPILCFLPVLCLAAAAQNSTSPSGQPSPTATPVARPGDVDTIDHILAAVYDVISGPPGPRDWNRFRSLFCRDARLIPSRRDPGGKASAVSLSPDDYAKRGADYFSKEGFFENAVVNRVEMWDHIAHVWSSYESRHAKGEAPFARGINSFQLLYDGSRWWILTIYWEGEDKDHPIPEKYLK